LCYHGLTNKYAENDALIRQFLLYYVTEKQNISIYSLFTLKSNKNKYVASDQKRI